MYTSSQGLLRSPGIGLSGGSKDFEEVSLSKDSSYEDGYE